MESFPAPGEITGQSDGSLSRVGPGKRPSIAPLHREALKSQAKRRHAPWAPIFAPIRLLWISILLESLPWLSDKVVIPLTAHSPTV